MNQILLATGNKGKAKEMQLVLQSGSYNLITLKDAEELLGQKAPIVVEDGKTYFDNCLIKAKAYHQWSGFPVIADDTGLEVLALNNQPGIYSARFGGENLTAVQRNIELLKLLTGVEQRQARFVCEIIFLKSITEFTSVSAELSGSIANEINGNGGFGYDSVFIVASEGKTLAEIKEVNPGFLTHRKIALAKLNDSGLLQSFIQSY